MAKRELSAKQKKLNLAATKLQKEGGLETKTVTFYKIPRGVAIKKAAANIKKAEKVSFTPGSTAKKGIKNSPKMGAKSAKFNKKK